MRRWVPDESRGDQCARSVYIGVEEGEDTESGGESELLSLLGGGGAVGFGECVGSISVGRCAWDPVCSCGFWRQHEKVQQNLR